MFPASLGGADVETNGRWCVFFVRHAIVSRYCDVFRHFFRYDMYLSFGETVIFILLASGNVIGAKHLSLMVRVQ